MVIWNHQECTICSANLNKIVNYSRGKIEIGRNDDGKMETETICPICQGAGWLKITRSFWGEYHPRFHLKKGDHP